MSEPCPNAKKYNRMNAGKVIGHAYKCNIACAYCHGMAHVQDCAECDGCGLRKGGVQCASCGCRGKVPASNAAA